MTLLIIVEIGSDSEESDENTWASFVHFRRRLKAETNISIILSIGPNLSEKRVYMHR